MSDNDVNKWLKFYDMSSPLTCLSEFVSHDLVRGPSGGRGGGVGHDPVR